MLQNIEKSVASVCFGWFKVKLVFSFVGTGFYPYGAKD